MKLVRPAWLQHKDENRTFEIYSLDASSDNKRLVTGGLDSKVKVWSTKAVRDPLAQTPQLLASMSAHTGAVTVVKFSPDSRFIASGSDDRIVLISELDKTRQPRNEFGTQNGQPAETEVWTPRKRLVGHDNDVQDLAWSPDGQLLVSVGLDSGIIVWSGTTFEKLKRLDWHQSHVKGVCFDPANKFFVTCSDDRTVRVVRYTRASPTELSFSVEAIVSSPFKDSPLTTYFRRCSWSPDGESIACPNATNGPIPTVAIIDRGRWSTDATQQTHLVGHEGTTEVARFSPRLYTNSSAGDNPASLVATAGEDGRVAVWATSNPRPVLVVQNIAQKMITDLAWGSNGLSLYVSSLDGTVVLIEFGSGDLGRVLPVEETQSRLEKYGNATDLMDIPQSVEQVALPSSKSEDKMDIDSDGSEAPTAPSSPKPQKKAQEKKPDTEAKNLDAQVDAQVVNQTDPQAPSETPAETSAETPVETSTQPTSTSTQPEAAENIPAPLPAKPRTQKTKQKTSFTKDGKRRVTPMLLNSASSDQPTQPINQIASFQPQSFLSYDKPSAAVPPQGIPGLVIGTKRKLEEDTNVRKLKASSEYLAPVVLNPATTVSNVRLATPTVVSHLSLDEKDVVFEARNAQHAGDPTKISMISNGIPVFTDFIAEYASLITGAATHFFAVASDTGVVYVYTPQGARMLPPLVLSAPLTLLTSKNMHLCAVTATGMVHLWDLSSRKACFPPQSLAPCLDSGVKMEPQNRPVKSPSITQIEITLEGELLLAFSTGNVFHFNTMLMSWERVSESFFAYGSRFWDGLSKHVKDDPIANSETWTNEEALLKDGARGRRLQRQAVNRSVQNGFHKFEELVSLTHLNHRLVAAQQLNMPVEKYLAQYTRRLCERGDKLKLVELFREVQYTYPQLLDFVLKIADEHVGSRTLAAEFRD